MHLRLLILLTTFAFHSSARCDLQSAAAQVVLPSEVTDLDLRFRQLLKERVTTVFTKDLEKLDNAYQGGLVRAIAAEQAAGNLDGIIAIEAEKSRFQDKQGLPETDDESLPASLNDLRSVYRQEHSKLITTRAENLKILVDPLQARLVTMEADLTRAGRLDDAKAVRVYRQELAEEVISLGGVVTTSTETSVGQSFEGKEAGETREIGGIEMVWCPAGSFTMGSATDEPGRQYDESPVDVRISQGYWLAKTETTQKQWAAFMKSNPSYYMGDDLPVERVSWSDAKSFVNTLNEAAPLPKGWAWALPTEAQWEYACRAGTKTTYNFGADFDGSKIHSKDSKVAASTEGASSPRTVPVDALDPNAWGLHNMHGNVREWCEDWHEAKLSGGTDPAGPPTGTIRVRRGGSWNHDAASSRSACRHKGPVDDKNSDLGLRLAVVKVAD